MTQEQLTRAKEIEQEVGMLQVHLEKITDNIARAEKLAAAWLDSEDTNKDVTFKIGRRDLTINDAYPNIGNDIVGLMNNQKTHIEGKINTLQSEFQTL